MSKNPLRELWRILNNKTKPKDKTLFEWRHLHLRAVWREGADDKGKVIDAPKNIIFVRYESGKVEREVAYALVDVLFTEKRLRVRPLAARDPGKAWIYDANKMGEENKDIPLRDIELPEKIEDISQGEEPIIYHVYQRGDAKYAPFLRNVSQVWKDKTTSFFTLYGEPTEILPEFSVVAKNWSMGITLKGLGYVRDPGPSGVIKMPVSWGTSLGFEEKDKKIQGIHYAGLALIDNKHDARIPLGMLFLDTLFLDSFSLTPHVKTRKKQPGKKWAVDGAFAEFFNYLPKPSITVRTHENVNVPHTTEKNEVTASNFTSYNITQKSGFFMSINKNHYKPRETISFVFGEDDTQELKNAIARQNLMKALVSHPLRDADIQEILKGMSPDLFPSSITDRQRLSSHIFGSPEFLGALLKKPDDDAAIAEKKKLEKAAAIKAYKDAVAAVQLFIQTLIEKLDATTAVKNWDVYRDDLVNELNTKITTDLNSPWKEAKNAGATAKELGTSPLDVLKKNTGIVDQNIKKKKTADKEKADKEAKEKADKEAKEKADKEALIKLIAEKKKVEEDIKKEDATTKAGRDKIKELGDEIDKLNVRITELEKILAKVKIKPVPKAVGKTRREITYGSAKPAAATLYNLGSRGRITVERMREDPIYIGLGDGPEVSNLSNLNLEFYGSSGAALASSLSMGASIQAKGLIPKGVTADGGRLEQTSFNYYYAAYWVDEYTGFETSGGSGNVTSFPGNYITIPERGAILYHLGATTIGSVSYDFATMAEQVSLDNPDFEIMLHFPTVGESVEASPGSSRLSNSGAIILGLRLPEGGSGAYSVRSIAYAPKLIKM